MSVTDRIFTDFDRIFFSGTEDHISISVGDVDSVLSGRTQESGGGGSCAGASGSGRLHTVTVHMEQDRANQDSTRALAGSLLNYDPPVNEGTK